MYENNECSSPVCRGEEAKKEKFFYVNQPS